MTKTINTKYLRCGLVLIMLMPAAGLRATELSQEDGIMTNHSAEYVRSLNRNTSTDADAAFYNPAGLAFLKQEGLHISFSSQTYHVEKKHTLDFYALKKDYDPGAGELIETRTPPHKQASFKGTLPDEYTAQLTAPVLPGLDVVWKQDRWAAYFDLAVTQAAVNMTFGDGLAVLDWGNLLAYETGFDPDTLNFVTYSTSAEAVRNEMYLGFTLGGAYEFFNWLSAGGGLRVIHARGNMKVKIDDIQYLADPAIGGELVLEEGEEWNLDTDTAGFGVGLILSTHFRPEGLLPVLKGLEASFRFEYYAPMELEKTTNSFEAPAAIETSGNLDIFKDGTADSGFNGGAGYTHGNGSKVLKATYPSTLNLGLSYLLFDWIKFLSSGQISLRQMRDLDGREDDYNIGFQAGFGLEFILNQAVTLSTGYLYNDFGIKPEKRTEADMLLSSHQIGAGGKFRVDENLEINIGGFYQYFIPATAFYEQNVNVTGPTTSYLRKDFEEMRYSAAIGVTYRMFGSSDSAADDSGDEEVYKPADSKGKGKRL
jgi:long-chain fatty acid transport protein